MKFNTKFTEFLNESKNEDIINSFDQLTDGEKMILRLIMKGEKSYGFHGTNRDFDKFDMSYIREWRADIFLGKGIFLSPSKRIAEKYANANANDELPLSILDDAKKIDTRLYQFMYSLYYNGNSTWSNPDFKWIHNDWKFEVDPNDVAEIVNKIPGSQSLKDYEANNTNKNNGFEYLFSTSTSALSEWVIEYLKKLGFGDYSPKIYSVYIYGSDKVLLSNSSDEIKNDVIHDIIIAYDTEDLIDNIPEIIVKKPELIKIVLKENLD